jgi:pimeloyl-ACP methyl ester carboxylesterase
VTYDARGHARSPAPDDPAAYREAALVADLAGVARGCGDPAPVAGGLSMGAAVALHLALDDPAAVRALVLASLPAALAAGVGEGLAGRAEAFAAAIDAEGLEAAGARFVWGPASGLDREGAALVRQGFLEHPPHGLAHTLRQFLARLPSAEPLAPRLARLEHPVLVVSGEGDPASRAAGRALAERLPHARLVEIPGAGHVVNLARPDAFNAALEAFLERLP